MLGPRRAQAPIPSEARERRRVRLVARPEEDMRVRDLWHRSKLGQILEGNQLVANDESAAKAFIGVRFALVTLQLVGFPARIVGMIPQHPVLDAVG